MDGDFYVAASLATTLSKVALRYMDIVQDKKRQNVSKPGVGEQQPEVWPLSSRLLSVSVFCCGGHAHHGHCAASGQVLPGQEANYRRRRGPHLAVPEGPVGALAADE